MKLPVTFLLALLCWSSSYSQLPQYAWSKIFGGPITEAAIGSDGYIYVIGQWSGSRDFDPGAPVVNYSSSAGGGLNAVYFGKYTQSGELVWIQAVISENANVYASSLILDEANNLYVYFASPDTDLDIDPGAGVVKLYEGNQYIGGSYNGGYVCKYSSDGELTWSNPVYREAYSGVIIEDIVYDGVNVYATGAAPADYYSGWVRYGDGPNCGCYLYTPSGFNATSMGFYVSWNAETGDANATNTGLASGAGNVPPKLAFDDMNYRYMLSYVSYDQYAGIDLSKYEPYSALEAWSRNDVLEPDYYIDGLTMLNVVDFQVDNDHNIYFAGTFSTSGPYGTWITNNNTPPDSIQTSAISDGDIFVAKFDPLGYGEWLFQVANEMSYDNCTAFEVDKATGNFYIAGSVTGTNDFDPGPGVYNVVAQGSNNGEDYVIASYTTNAEIQYARHYEGGPSVRVFPDDILLDGEGNLILAGRIDNGPIDVDLTDDGEAEISAPSSLYGLFLSYASCSGAPEQPEEITGETLVCMDNTYEYSIAEVEGATSYTWSLPNGWSGSSTEPLISVEPGVDGGVVYVTANNACGISPQRVLTISTYTPSVTANVNDDTVCEGEGIILTGSGVVSYEWDNGVEDGVVFIPSGSNTYTVTGTDANGCSGTDMITIEVLTNPLVTANASATEICEGNQVVLYGGGAEEYEWNNNVVDNQAFSPDQTLTYEVTGIASNGCTAIAEITVEVNLAPIVLFTLADNLVCTTDPVVILNASPSGGDFFGTGVTGNSFNPSAVNAGTYSISYVYTNGEGCTGSESQDIVVEVCENIFESNDHANISVYPNPSSAMSSVEWNGSAEQLTITDAQGKSVCTYNVRGLNRMTLDASTFSTGVYFLTLADAKQSSRIKWIVK